MGCGSSTGGGGSQGHSHGSHGHSHGAPTSEGHERGEHAARRASEIAVGTGTFVKRNMAKFSSLYSVKHNGHLGSGSFASVFLATHRETGTKRAVKAMVCVKKGQEDDGSIRQEIDIMRHLDHPNVVKVLEYFVEGSKWLFVLELCSGGELFDRICKEKRFGEQKAAHFMRQILTAVCYCHGMGVAHRDIKPENILFESEELDSRLKLSDFGYSAFIKPGQRLHDRHGSPYYVAPEVLTGDYDEKCDLWSCGVLLYILLDGSPPFNGRDKDEILGSVSRGQYVMKSLAWSRVSPLAKDLVEKLLTYDPKARVSAHDALTHPWLVENHDHVEPNSEIIHRLTRFKEQELLQRAVRTYIGLNALTAKKKEELAKSFEALDTDGDGVVSRNEMLAGLSTVLAEANLEKISDKFAALDINRDGHIDFGEFVLAAMDEESVLAENNLRAAFGVFDTDGNGYISGNELRMVLGHARWNCSHEDATWSAIIGSVDKNGDGKIDFEEFKSMMAEGKMKSQTVSPETGPVAAPTPPPMAVPGAETPGNEPPAAAETPATSDS
mmetsp:Transcript_41658/g.97979  ORF Transcript_41658/g.97979 Transcript_41658/m.97979 type:complete len:553 (+) Transcript_41658:8-1666(+)